MKVRIKFQKFGAMKFIGHLDVMRYFQKAFRRAGYDSEYTKGFNPHQIMSFAAPLGVGLTSDCEYVDIGLNSSEEPELMLKRINAVMSEGFYVTGYHILKEAAEHEKNVTAMSLVSSADYLVSLKDGYLLSDSIRTNDEFKEAFEDFYAKQDIIINKKTKKSETLVNIKPMITMISFDEMEYLESLKDNLLELFKHDNNDRSYFLNSESKADIYENNIKVYMQLDTGSVANLKPELVMEAFCNENKVPFNPYAWQVHRLEIYTRDETSDKLIALDRLER
ncbi:MAG: DUF2344 domain-containing protein [Anaerolineaceae bacterium]|nr:MAG: DUF2344 domain-containing protein [Anaerolineaceae bacterium]